MIEDCRRQRLLIAIFLVLSFLLPGCLTHQTERVEEYSQQGHLHNVNSVAFSSDGRFALSGSSDQTIKLWDVHTGKELRTFIGHSNSVTSVTFSPDANYVLSGSWDKTIKLWDVHTGKELKTFTGHLKAVTSVVF